jgi:hypothetical protein
LLAGRIRIGTPAFQTGDIAHFIVANFFVIQSVRRICGFFQTVQSIVSESVMEVFLKPILQKTKMASFF